MGLKRILAAALFAAPWLAGAQEVAWGSRDRVTPPFPPTMRAEPRVEKLVRQKTKYLRLLSMGTRLSDPSEYTIRARTSTLLTLATCLRFASCEEPAETRDDYVKMLDELVSAHYTGGGVTASGKPWGHEWQSSYWTWQATFSAWLMWWELSPPLRRAVLAMAIDEADRFLEMPAPYARFLDTKAEENAWNSMLLVLLGEILESHPHHARWRERGLEYMISAFAAGEDRTSKRVVEGKPLSAWLGGANVHPDFTLENHGFVHPDYMACIGLNLTNALVYRLLARRVPEAVTFNAQPVYDVLKFFTAADGGLFYPGSTDWSLHRLDLTWSTALQMDRLAHDPQAGALGDLALDTMERMHARYGDGRMFAQYEFTTYKTIEAVTSTSLDVGLMFARMWMPAEPSEPIETVWKQLEGARVFEDGRLFVMRTPKAINSFSWGTRIMGVAEPFAKDTIVWPVSRGYFGLGAPIVPGPLVAGRLGIGSKAFEDAARKDDTALQGAIHGSENGATFVTLRARQAGRGKVVSFTALPSGKSVYMERVDGDTANLWGGMIGLLEEPEWFYGRASRAVERDANRWVNIDGRLGYAMSENGTVDLVPDLRSRLLVLNKAPRSGSIAAIVTLPGASAAETREFAARPFRLKVRQAGVAAVEVDGLLVVTNTTQHPLTAEVERGASVVEVPVNGFSTRVVF
jgi:hypothetical protein